MMAGTIRCIIALMRFFYFFFKLATVRNKVVMISRQSDGPSVDFVLMKKAMMETMPDYEIVILTKRLKNGALGAVAYLPHLFVQMHHISTARIVLLDSYCIPVSVLKHRSSLLIIQMWHAIGLLKKAGHSILDTAEGRSSTLSKSMHMHENYSYICSSSEACRDGIAEVFNYPVSSVIVKTLPRVDYLRDNSVIDSAKKIIAAAYPKLSGKVNILYAPTHRRSDGACLQERLEELTRVIDFSRFNLIVKPHPLSHLLMDKKGVIFDTQFTSLEMAMFADLAIIDYSSILFEIALLNKPIYFYTYDVDEYIKTPGFFIDFLNEVPGTKHTVASDVIKDIDSRVYDGGAMERFLNKYVDLSEVNCAYALATFVKNEVAA